MEDRVKKIGKALRLLNSMVLSGELHSDKSTKVFYEATTALNQITENFKQFNLWCIKETALHFTGDFVACEHNKRFKTQEELYSFWENEINK